MSCSARFGTNGLRNKRQLLQWLAGSRPVAVALGVLLLLAAQPVLGDESREDPEVTPQPPVCPSWLESGERLSYKAAQLSNVKEVPLQAGGDVDLTRCATVPGLGHIAHQPDITMRFGDNDDLRTLEFLITGDCETTLLVNTADQRWRFDNGGGRADAEARVRVFEAPEGYYDIWAGTAGDETCDARLFIKTYPAGELTPDERDKQRYCPDWMEQGRSLSYITGELRQAQEHPVQPGGELDLSQCSSVPGYGFVTHAPNYTLSFRGNHAGWALELRVVSTCNAILLVNDPVRQWHFDSDSNGRLDPRLRLRRAHEGDYDIWVGQVGGGPCKARLFIQTFPSH